jgi:uncharacterized membrane protein
MSEGVRSITWVFELVVAPLVFTLCLRHAHRALGAGRAAVELGALVLYGFALERVAMSVFASHLYGTGWRVAPLGVPLAVALVWASLILSGLTLAARLSLRTPLACAAATVLFGISLDLLMEPVAVAAGLWSWTPPGPWLLVPVGNFVGWAVIVGVYAWGTEAYSARGSLARQALVRLALALVALGALVVVGFAWRALRAEERLTPAAGWAFWAAVLLATLLVGLRRRWSAVGTSLGSRLGVVPGHGPALVFLVSAAAFATQAMFVEEPNIRLAALGPALVLFFVAGRDVRHRALQSWRERMHGRLSGVESLVAVLMKRRNGKPWTREELAFLQGELRALARWVPALLLFLLPGSVLLLPIYAWLLDRRKGERAGEGV